MRNIYFNSGRQNCLLLFLVILFFSCKEKDTSLEKKDDTVIKNDSLFISIKLPPNKSTGLNINDNYGNLYALEFVNSSNEPRVIVKKIIKYHKNQIINYYGGFFNKGTIIKHHHFFLIDSTTNNLELEYQKGNVFMTRNNSAVNIDSIYNSYNILKEKIYNANEKRKKELENTLIFLYKKNKNKFKNDSLLNALNNYHYIESLQKIRSLDPRVDKFMKNINIDFIQNSVLNSIIYSYTKSRINKFKFEELNNSKFSVRYIKLLSFGIFNFLSKEDNKGDLKYQAAKDWLKNTKLYKNDSLYIKKEITPLNNIIFKRKLKKIKLSDIQDKELLFYKVLKENPSNYYLIDFWATWCAPCIEGVNIMNKMNISKNVKVISFSVDKEKDKEKWHLKTKELKQELTYWFNEENKENKGFTEFIEMKSIPRYVLIDKNMNLIDQAFYHPQEPQFLSKLNDVKNYKYW